MAITQISSPPIRQRSFRQPTTEIVKGTFCVAAASSPCFWRKVAPIGEPEREFCETIRPYSAVLLTMIKIVLIAAISFASPSQSDVSGCSGQAYGSVALSHRVGHETGFELARGVSAILSGMRKK